MRTLFIVTSLIEWGAGLALIVQPSAAALLLIGSALSTTPAVITGRLAGIALVTLGLACWFVRLDTGAGARGVIAAMTFYNLGAVILLSAARLHWNQKGKALWPAATLHTLMSMWCVKVLLG